MTTAHTPTPWIATSDCHYDAASYLIETQNGKLVIATCHEGDADEVLDCSANAAFIVKCVNAHDALVSALHSTQELLLALLDSTSEPKARELLVGQLDTNTRALAGAE